MPWYTFRGPVRVFDDEDELEVDDDAVLKTIDGLTYDDETLAEHLELDSFRDSDVEGGTIELRWVEDHLEVRTAYEIPSTLEPPELDELQEFTHSQWAAGLGLTLVTEFLERTGLRLDLAPDDGTELEVEIED